MNIFLADIQFQKCRGLILSWKDCIKKFCDSLREYAKNIVDVEKKKMLALTKNNIMQKYQRKLELSMKRSDFIFDSVQLMYHKCDKGNFNRNSSYIDSPDWIKNKKATISKKYTLCDVIKFILVLSTFPLIQQSLTRTRCWLKSLHSVSKLLLNWT